MTVYVVQTPMTRDRETGEVRSKFDYAAAEEFGRVEVLLSDHAKPWDRGVIRELERKLLKFSDGDWLILTGNPCLMGAAACFAADRTGGRLRLLQWGNGRYQPVSIDLWEEADLPERAARG